MVRLGYNKSLYDCCVYHNKVDDDLTDYLLVYIGNMLIVAKSKSNIKKLKDLLCVSYVQKPVLGYVWQRFCVRLVNMLFVREFKAMWRFGGMP